MLLLTLGAQSKCLWQRLKVLAMSLSSKVWESHDDGKLYTLCCQSCPSFPLENLSCIGYPQERRELKQQSFVRVTKRPLNNE